MRNLLAARKEAVLLTTASLAVALPTLVTWNAPPVTSFIPQAFALFGWGVWLAQGATTFQKRDSPMFPLGSERGLRALLVALMLLVAAILASGSIWGLPLGIMTREAALVLAAMVVVPAGAALMRCDATGQLLHEDLIRTLLLAFVAAGALNAGIAMLQYMGSQWVVEPMGRSGRPGGHLRQPNLLATQLHWALLALVALRETGWVPRSMMALLGLPMMVAIALSASRMGALACLLPLAWGLMDHRLSRTSRVLLIGTPLVVALSWWGLSLAAPALGQDFAGVGQLQKADLTSSRGTLWRQSMELIAQNPWLGVGWGQFNLAWTLTPLESITRSGGHTFTHAHNLFIHWAVELGVPLTLLLSALLALATWRAWALARASVGVEAVLRRAALAMVLIMLWHSQFEFPLWQAHFLLPTACLWGLALGGGPGRVAPSRRRSMPASLVGGLMALAATLALWDYLPVSRIYYPPNDGLSDESRIARGRESLLSGHFADRFAGTLAPAGQRQLQPFERVTYEMLDVRLLRAWILAEAEAGRLERAAYLSARLRELDDPQTRNFFAVCDTPDAASSYRCRREPLGLTFRDFR